MRPTDLQLTFKYFSEKGWKRSELRRPVKMTVRGLQGEIFHFFIGQWSLSLKGQKCKSLPSLLPSKTKLTLLTSVTRQATIKEFQPHEALAKFKLQTGQNLWELTVGRYEWRFGRTGHNATITQTVIIAPSNTREGRKKPNEHINDERRVNFNHR